MANVNDCGELHDELWELSDIDELFAQVPLPDDVESLPYWSTIGRYSAPAGSPESFWTFCDRVADHCCAERLSILRRVQIGQCMNGKNCRQTERSCSYL